MSEDSIDIALAEAYEGGLSAAKARIAELEAQLKYTEQHAADLEVEILALRKDAARYVILRSGINLPKYGNGIGNRLAATSLDAAIDAALLAQGSAK